MSNLVINVFPTMNELVARLRDDLENKPNEIVILFYFLLIMEQVKQDYLWNLKK